MSGPAACAVGNDKVVLTSVMKIEHGATARWLWPLSIRREAEVTNLYLPEHLRHADAEPPAPGPTLEEIAGDGWLQKVLSTLLPRGVVWGWWTRTEVVRASKLRTRRSQDLVRLDELETVLAKSLLFRRMTLALIPPLAAEQERVLHWAGQDTEHVADVLFAARPSDAQWLTAELIDRSVRGRWRSEPKASLATVERVIILADGELHCALPTTAAEAAVDGLRALAATWNIEIAEG